MNFDYFVIRVSIDEYEGADTDQIQISGSNGYKTKRGKKASDRLRWTTMVSAVRWTVLQWDCMANRPRSSRDGGPVCIYRYGRCESAELVSQMD